MKNPTSEWFQSLSQKERKDLVSTLYGVRDKVQRQASTECFQLFDRFLSVLDDEYHALKR